MIKQPRILYFIGSAVATPEESADARRYGTNVAFRNASFVDVATGLEKCDGVAGKVPDVYAKAFPDAATVIAEFNKQNAPVVPAAPKAEVPPAPVVPPAPPVVPPAPPPAAPVVTPPAAPVVPDAGWGKPPQQ